MNKHASALGKLARGKPKNFSQAELKKRKTRLAQARKVKAEMMFKKLPIV